MSCFFCKSRIHASQNCNVYKSDESRQKRADVKKCCRRCLTALKERSSCCVSCKQNEKCYICFSPHHHTFYCPDRLTAPNLFFPRNIDSDLLPRFMAVLNVHEKYLMAFSYPQLFKLIRINPLKVFYKDYVVFPDFHRCSLNPNELNVVESVYTKCIKCNCRRCYYNEQLKLELSIKSHAFLIGNLSIGSPSLLAEDVLLLISFKTRTLFCGCTKFSPKLTFRKILQSAPNLEEINICLTDVEVDSSWADDLLEFNKAESLRRLDFAIPDLNFNAESLAVLMKKQSAINLIIHLYIIVPRVECFDTNKNINIFEKLKNKLANFFIPVKYEFQQCIRIRTVCDTALWIMSHEFQNFALKNC